MNCVPGDLAVIVRSHAGNEGKIVRCVRFVGTYTFLTANNATHTATDVWALDRRLVGCNGAYGGYIEDKCLRPIRDQPGADESLTWAPKREPQPTKEPA